MLKIKLTGTCEEIKSFAVDEACPPGVYCSYGGGKGCLECWERSENVEIEYTDEADQ